jgi:hypothetical protein
MEEEKESKKEAENGLPLQTAPVLRPNKKRTPEGRECG